MSDLEEVYCAECMKEGVETVMVVVTMGWDCPIHDADEARRIAELEESDFDD